MVFKRDSAGRDNMEIVLDLLKENGPMTVRDITKAVSGYEVGDSQYSFYSRTITTIITKMLKWGHVTRNGLDGTLMSYGFVKPLAEQVHNRPDVSEGKHMVYGHIVDVGSDGMIHEICDMDGKRMRVFIPASMSKRGQRMAIDMPISMDRLRRGLQTGRFDMEVIG